MRLQLASDLHLEHLARHFPGERLITPAPDADLLVLAGDIANGVDAVSIFADWPVPVLYVAGNHEFYGHSWEQARVDLKAACRNTSVQVLDTAAADLSAFSEWAQERRDELSRIRFLGTTLWTDYQLELSGGRARAMTACHANLVDHRAIRTQEGLFTPRQALEAHEQSRRWLEYMLAKPFDGKTVVISHHGPHERSIHPRFRTPQAAAINAGFASDLTPLLGKVDLWLHGHVHDSFDYEVDGCRVVTNPRGYPRQASSADVIADVAFENPNFRSALVIEV